MKRNLKLEEDLKQWYKWRTGKELNIENPQTFNEKIQWLKLYDSTSLKGKLADKYESKEWLRNELGKDYSIPIIGVWDKFDDIDFDKLPDKFVLKATHGSGWNIIVKDKSKLDKVDAKQKFDWWLATDYGKISREYHYSYIKPRIIAEEYVDGELIDYRFFCYNGEPKEIWVDRYSGTSKHIRTIFDADFNRKDVRCTWGDNGVPVVSEKPKSYDKMIEISKKLASHFVFVRIDFYDIDGQAYIGELTFTPTAGLVDHHPESHGLKCGQMLDLSPLMK